MHKTEIQFYFIVQSVLIEISLNSIELKLSEFKHKSWSNLKTRGNFSTFLDIHAVWKMRIPQIKIGLHPFYHAR